MREITIDGKQVRVRANPLALLYYKQEFKADLMGDLSKWQNVANDPASFDSIAFLQVVWAMAKAGSTKPTEFPSFATWLGTLESFDFNDETMLSQVTDEAIDGFFRGGSAGRSSK